jgi:hypothetical protein
MIPEDYVFMTQLYICPVRAMHVHETRFIAASSSPIAYANRHLLTEES